MYLSLWICALLGISARASILPYYPATGAGYYRTNGHVVGSLSAHPIVVKGPEVSSKAIYGPSEGPVLVQGPQQGPVSIVGPSEGPASVIGPRAGAATIIGPNAGAATIVGPNAGAATIVGPNAGAATIVGPNAGAATIRGPSAGAATIIGPSSAGATIIGPSEGGATIVGPSEGGATIVGPSTGGATIIGPSTGGSTLVGPSSAGATIVGPSVGHTTIIGPSVSAPVVHGPVDDCDDGSYTQADAHAHAEAHAHALAHNVIRPPIIKQLITPHQQVYVKAPVVHGPVTRPVTVVDDDCDDGSYAHADAHAHAEAHAHALAHNVYLPPIIKQVVAPYHQHVYVKEPQVHHHHDHNDVLCDLQPQVAGWDTSSAVNTIAHAASHYGPVHVGSAHGRPVVTVSGPPSQGIVAVSSHPGPNAIIRGPSGVISTSASSSAYASADAHSHGGYVKKWRYPTTYVDC